jgi:hypothetical protein
MAEEKEGGAHRENIDGEVLAALDLHGEGVPGSLVATKFTTLFS